MIACLVGACREYCGCEQCSLASKILLVGEMNPLSMEPQYALYCHPERCSGHRLQDKIFGLDAHTYLSMWRTNLCVGTWSVKKARARAHELRYVPFQIAPELPNPVTYCSEQVPWSVIVMLGVKVTAAFAESMSIPFNLFEAKKIGPTQYVCLPHPSGLNRVWSRPASIESARLVLSSVAPELPWGASKH